MIANELTEQIKRSCCFLKPVGVSRVVDPANERLAEVLLREGVSQHRQSFPTAISGFGFVRLQQDLKS